MAQLARADALALALARFETRANRSAWRQIARSSSAGRAVFFAIAGESPLARPWLAAGIGAHCRV
jgi:hypothetical protein